MYNEEQYKGYYEGDFMAVYTTFDIMHSYSSRGIPIHLHLLTHGSLLTVNKILGMRNNYHGMLLCRLLLGYPILASFGSPWDGERWSSRRSPVTKRLAGWLVTAWNQPRHTTRQQVINSHNNYLQ